MSKKNIELKPGGESRQRTLVIGLVCLFIGFFMGVGFTTYKINRTQKAVSGSNPSVDYEKKASSLEAQVAQNPENTSAWTQLGDVYYDTDQYSKAVEAYKKSLALYPENADVLTDLGVMYRRSGRPGMAIKSFDKAISIDHKHEAARFNKGIVLMHDLNQKEKALKVWEELLEINPIAMVGKDQSLDQLIKHYKEHKKNTSE
ncbi:MAG: tetratricopeptide repeat protein [Deltaproteobacteria bacterium]|nr:tetratricopeptide repeat protein [Deltaproteobacteria bacterium]